MARAAPLCYTGKIDRRHLLVVFAAAACVRIAIGLVHPAYGQIDDVEINLIAKSVAQGRGYGNPFSETVDTGPTALASPLYVLLQAAIFAVFGTGAAGARALSVLSSLISGALCASLPWLAARAGLPRVTGLAAAAAAIVPLHFWIEIKGAYEQPATALLIVLLTGLFYARARAAAVGLLAGAGLMVSSALAAPLGGLLLAIVKPGRQHLSYAATVIAVAAVLQLPWTIRNWQALGSPVVLRDNLGLELWISNNPAAAANQARNQAGYRYAEHPFVSPDGFARYRLAGELSFFDSCRDRAAAWIRDNPAAFARLTLQRVLLFWFPRMTRSWQSGLRWPVTLSGFAGLLFLLREGHPLARLIGSIWLAYPLLYYLVSAQDRYSYPLYPLQLLLAAHAAVSLYRRLVTSGR